MYVLIKIFLNKNPILATYCLYGFRVRPFVWQICRIIRIGYYTIKSKVLKKKMIILPKNDSGSGFAAGDINDSAVNITGTFGGQKADRAGNFAELAASSEGD